LSGGIVAIVPVKQLSEVKGRLAPRLGPAERASFALESLERVLTAMRGCAAIEVSLVVSSDPEVRARAVAASAAAVDEVKSGDIAGAADSHNRALEHARNVALRRWQPSALLVLAADLPLVVSEDLDRLLAVGQREGSVVIAPDREGTGTNALLLRPPSTLPFRFGSNSFQRHADEARHRNLHLEIFRSVGTAHDVDVPQDLDELAQLEGLKS
jgi:2-phospho-L-lactate guanylyltransferase